MMPRRYFQDPWSPSETNENSRPSLLQSGPVLVGVGYLMSPRKIHQNPILVR